MNHSGPIPALMDYYQRLIGDPNQDVAPLGFSRQKISFRVVLELSGRPVAFQETRQQEGKRLVPLSLTVPGQAKSSGAGINPGFLWDNAQYLLGVKADDPKPERTQAAFTAFRKRHADLLNEIQDEQYAAVCHFLEQWNPADVAAVSGHELLQEPGSGFGVFQIRGQAGYVHDRFAVQEYWRRASVVPEQGALQGQSLVCGRNTVLARLHEPKIKGVFDAQSSGAVLVGFNADAYTSYGKTQSYNAPVGQDEAFQYCTALNKLLEDTTHRARLGDATVVFWSDRPTETESLLAALFGADAAADTASEDSTTTQRVAHFCDAVKRGLPHEGFDGTGVPFYILGLSPNAARISVRFWLPTTTGELADHLARHVRDLDVIGGREGQPLTVRRLLMDTAREAKDIPPQLAGEVARAIISGLRYPQALLSAVIRRIRADQTSSAGQMLSHSRAAIVKACLIRNYQMEVTVALNTDHPDPAYHMGRLFAALEKTQEDALPGINKTIKDAYYSTASTTPASVFPRVIRLHQHHIEKLDRGRHINRERLVQSIISQITAFPAHLPLERQGLFHLGYYHQRQDFFTKRESTVATTPTAEEPVNV